MTVNLMRAYVLDSILLFPYFFFHYFFLSLFYSPLVAGTSESDQLDRIFRLFGTPSISDYPGIVELPEYSPDQYPPYPPPRGGLQSLVPTIDPTGVDLLSRMLQYDPSCRITAQAAMEHAFFGDMKGGQR